jgi:acyl-homoserine lactone acylase PvdQ
MGAGVDYTFNWFYIDAEDIGYQHSCKCPQRAQGVDPVPAGAGRRHVRLAGLHPLAQQPFDLNPHEGCITSWNNKQAPQFRAHGLEFSTARLPQPDARLRHQGGDRARHRSTARRVDAMEDAGTVDLRGQEDLPLLLR